MLAFGDSPEECLAKCAECFGDDWTDDDCETVQVTDALADSSGESWAWLPGSDSTIACTLAEAE